MSADNFIALRYHDASGKYIVTDESASADEMSDLDAVYARQSRILALNPEAKVDMFDTWSDARDFVVEIYRDGSYIVEYGPHICPQPVWENDSIQFPRLLSEIIATHELNLSVLAESMDLTVDDVNELMDRAQERWERIKER